MDRSMIKYSDSTSGLENMLINDTCTKIYNDFLHIYSNYNSNPPDDSDMYVLLKKYDKHYLVYYFLGKYYSDIGNLDAALTCYKICIKKYPLADAYLNMAIIFQKCGQFEIVKKIMDEAYKFNSKDLRILNFLGAMYYVEKDYYKAIDHYKEIIKNNYKGNSDMKNIFNNIGFSCSAVGKCEKALNYFENGLQIKCDTTPENIKMDLQLLQNKLINYDYMYKNPNNIFDEFLRINTILNTINTCHRKISKVGRLKIGFVSPDLRQHVCAFFLEPILKYFDRTKFIVYCYANIMNEDRTSEKFKNFHGINWFNIFNKPVDEVCKLIDTHAIDILIDLAGHTNNNSLEVFAKKPAPIQITYLGYPNGTGLTSMDYRITDKHADPPTTKQKFTEKLIYLPRCFVCYTTSIDLSIIPVEPTRHKFITFGVMNKLNKHNKTTFEAWSRIVKSVPNSVLLIKRDMKSAFDIRVKYLRKLGLHDHQIKVTNYVADENEYYKMYNDIDICLDTFPYSGTTTSCDAFLMSTPIVTYGIPDRHVSNVTKSMLYNMGFPELVTSNIEEYVSKSVNLANDINKIIYYKCNIRQKFLELMNGKLFSKEFDDLLLSLRN